MRKFRFATVGLGVLALALPFQNCSKMRGQSVGQASSISYSSSDDTAAPEENTPEVQDLSSIPAQVRANACNLIKIQAAQNPVKILVIVDMSGSNAGDPTHVGTDPDKRFRLGSLTQFVNDYGNNSNISWGFEVFQDTRATALLNDGAGQGVFATAAHMQNAINVFAATSDAGQTPYLVALNMARSMISADLAKSALPPDYAIVFLSDGLPTDVSGGTAEEKLTMITPQISDLTALSPGHISFSTVYYGAIDPSAAGVLSGMAQAGGGKFIDLNLNPSVATFMISSSVTMPSASCAR